MRVVVAFAALVALALFVPSTASAVATADFSVSDDNVLIGEEVTFDATASAGNGPLLYEWDLDGDGLFDEATGVTVTRDFASAGTKTVGLKVTDADPTDASTTKQVTVTAPPVAVADFTATPDPAQVGQQITFDASGSTGEAPLTYGWEFDGDNDYNDATSASAVRSFATAGTRVVGLKVTGSNSSTDTLQKTITLTAAPPPANRLPTASFRVFPASPLAGEPAAFVSISSDPDGPIASHAWDLDGDGQFDDAAGATASRAYPAGSRVVRLRVTDSAGAASVQTRTIVVAPRLVTARLLSPFPVVRLVGRLTRTGARIRRFTVAAPAGSEIVLRCNGPRCPVKRLATVSTRTGPAIRFKTFERRLRAGVVLQVFVLRDGAIGKHTRFAIRKRRSPSRRDRCLQPGVRTPSECPGA